MITKHQMEMLTDCELYEWVRAFTCELLKRLEASKQEVKGLSRVKAYGAVKRER